MHVCVSGMKGVDKSISLNAWTAAYLGGRLASGSRLNGYDSLRQALKGR